MLEDAKAWQHRPLERLYPIVYLDALVVKIREGHAVRNFACYVAIGVNLEGERDVLGLWFQRTEGAKFWMHVLTDIKTRGVQDVLFVCVDGLSGFVEAIEATFPHATVQTCLVHQVRASLKFVSYKDRKQVAADLRKIYTAANQDHAADELQAFAEKWDAPLPDDQPELARALGADHPVPRLPRRRPPGDLHDQLDRGAAPPDPQDHQDPRALPDRGRRPQADLPRDHQSRDQMAASAALALSARSVQDPVPRPDPRRRLLATRIQRATMPSRTSKTCDLVTGLDARRQIASTLCGQRASHRHARTSVSGRDRYQLPPNSKIPVTA